MLDLVTIQRFERVAVLRDGAFIRLLRPGRRIVWTLFGLVETIRFDIRQVATPIDGADGLPAALPGTRVVEVGPQERVVLRVDGVVRGVLRTGRWRVWEEVEGVELLAYDTSAEPSALADEDRLLPAIAGEWTEVVSTRDVAAVLFRDGEPLRELGPGRYRTWAGGPWQLQAVRLDLGVLELAAQDLVTRDQVPVRVKPAAMVRVDQPVRHLAERSGLQHVHAAFHLALREVIAARDFDGLVADRESLSDDLLDRARALLPDVGLAIERAFVRDVILSAEVKAMVSRVTLARKESEAHSIRRREEVAATRQLANTAKLLEKSPVLLRLKELEALGELVQHIDKLVVVGGSDLTGQALLRDLAPD